MAKPLTGNVFLPTEEKAKETPEWKKKLAQAKADGTLETKQEEKAEEAGLPAWKIKLLEEKKQKEQVRVTIDRRRKNARRQRYSRKKRRRSWRARLPSRPTRKRKQRWRQNLVAVDLTFPRENGSGGGEY